MVLHVFVLRWWAESDGSGKVQVKSNEHELNGMLARGWDFYSGYPNPAFNSLDGSAVIVLKSPVVKETK